MPNALTLEQQNAVLIVKRDHAKHAKITESD
jgi:hypothetical protein